MKRYMRVGLILAILAILASSATFVAAAPIECSVSWLTDTTGPEVTMRPVAGSLLAYDIDGGIENVCTGRLPLDANRGKTMLSLYDACMVFYDQDQEYCGANQDFYLDNKVFAWDVEVVDPDNPDITYMTGVWSMYVDPEWNFTFTTTYFYP